MGWLSDRWKELEAQIVMGDNKTASTVRAARQPAVQAATTKPQPQRPVATPQYNYSRVAQTDPEQKAFETYTQQYRSGRIDKNRYSNLMNMLNREGVAKAKPTQDLSQRVADVFDGNSVADQWRRKQAGQQQYIEDQSIKERAVRAAQTTGLSAGRAFSGLGQDLSGLYDLASPGRGINRITKRYIEAGRMTDEEVNARHLDPNVYTAAQVPVNIAAYAAPGTLATKVASKVPAVMKATAAVSKVPGANRAISKLDDLAANGTTLERTAANVLRSYTKPAGAADMTADVFQNAGHRTSLGEDNNLKTFGTDALLSAGTQGAFSLGGQAASALGRGGAKVTTALAPKVSSAANSAPAVARATTNLVTKVDQKMFGNKVSLEGMNFKPGDELDMGDYTNHLLNIDPNMDGATRNLIIQRAREVGDRWGMDVTSGSAADITDRISKRLDEFKAAQRKAGEVGSVQIPGRKNLEKQFDGLKKQLKNKDLSPKQRDSIIRKQDKLARRMLDGEEKATMKKASLFRDEGGGYDGGKSASDRMAKREVPDFSDPAVELPKRAKQPTQFAKQEYTPPAKPSKTPTRTEFPDESKLNTQRLNLDDTQRAELGDETIGVVGNLSNKEVEKIAKSAGLDTKTHTIDQTKKKIAEQLNVRKDAVRLMNEAKEARLAGKTGDAERLLKEAAGQGEISRTQGADLARQLQARRIIANELDTPEMRVFKLLDNAGINRDVYAKRFADVDFSNSKQVIDAYRDLVKGSPAQWLDTLRYNSMLSSPLTQAVNIFGNLQNVALVAPIEKTLRGTIDAMGGLFGKQRQYAAGEGAAYSAGVAKNVGNAGRNFIDSLQGTGKYSNPDLTNDFMIPLATKGLSGATYKTLSAPMRVLDGFDKFFRTLAEGGEESALKARERAGIKVRGNRSAIKEAEAAYRVFQTPLGEPGQGVINNAFDEFAKLAMKGRGSKNPLVSLPSKFSVPFLTTLNNISKQGIVDFTPLGYANMAGNSDKITAFTRASMGTAVFGTSAALLSTGQMTWAEPRDADERNRFRAEGKQPYSVKFGDKWVNFSKLTPSISFPMALTAALDDAMKEKKLDQGNVDSILEAVSKYGNFLSDQSYAKSIGDTLGAVGGDKEAVARAISNNVQQVVPFRAMTGWIARMTDDTERKVDTTASYFDQQVESLMQNYPGLRQKTSTRDYNGSPIAANNQVFNAFSPVRVTKDRGVNPLDAEMDRLALANEKDPLLNKKQVKEVDKQAEAIWAKQQAQHVGTAEYQKLDDKEKAASLAKLKKDVRAVERQRYMAKNQVGEYAQDFSGKPVKLTTDQKRIMDGKPVSYTSDSDDKKTFAEKYENSVTKYEENKNDMSRLQRVKAEDEIRTLKVKKDFDDDTVSLYNMSKTDAYGFLKSDKDGKAKAKKLLAYGDAMVKAKLYEYNKFRDKDGNEAIQPKAKSGSRRRASGGGKRGGSRRTNFDLYSNGVNPLNFEKSLRKILEEARMA